MRALTRIFVILAGVLVLPVAQPALAETPKALVESLGDKAIRQLTGTVARPEREARFQNLLTAGFDIHAIGRFTLGRYWNQANPAQQAEYLKLFEKFIVQAYAARFAEYSGEQFRVVGERPDGEVTIVQSEVFKPGNPPARVEWRVRHGGQPKIVDVVVEGISMAVTQRSEFAAVISRGGGNVDSLLTALRQKTGS
ncbi:phospholipid transport system substrate-binding protein [Stella humosa]|uniref:Phospholipid transport system substrate-binding protein n=1 Tax=Stella humosa TaxID=94 RepID=A0A3N1KZL9_9PROT|nr:ABC transporter substrate-binding protein [Stella humosa]ROP84100.1 phospholipid transport system substrate-binding protein [Stella humosa]BBK33612.1 toluene tolerance protein [Stella humosa]